MKKENGILEKELGSYEILEGLSLVDRAYVEDDKVKLFVTIDGEVSDEEYNEIFDEYNGEELVNEGFSIEEVEEEYNPIWCITMEYKTDDGDMGEDLNYVLGFHKKQIDGILSNIRG